MSNLRILFIGATGYIGGSILSRLLQHPKRETFDITVLIRSAAKAKDFESFGLKTVIGSLDDLDSLERLASESDVVFQSADSDNLPATKAILKGIKTKFEKTNKPPVLIHTSGTGELIDNAQGKFAGGIIYSDLDVSAIEALSPTSPHRHVDTTIVAADVEDT
jgi:nucleoside-diphosphate-sugar epimerase